MNLVPIEPCRGCGKPKRIDTQCLECPAFLQPKLGAVTPNRGSRLEQLTAQYDTAKAAAKAAADALKAITDGIKLELTNLAPGETSIDLVSEHLAQPLRLVHVSSWRIDSAKLKADDPETYVRYAKQSGAWTLKAVGE